MDIVQKMFWSLIVKPEKRYQQTVEEAFHLSQVCMEPIKGAAAGNATPTLLYVELEGNDEILLAVLAKDRPNHSLDLNFGTGESITFRTEGPGTLHLSGYLHSDEPPMDYSSDDDTEDEEEDVPTLVPASKSKASPLDKALAEQKKAGRSSEVAPQNDKEVKKEIEKALNMRKKLAEDAKKGAQAESSDDEDDEDYEDMDDEEEGEEEEDDDDEDDEDDDEEDDEDDEEDDDEESEEESPKKNGNAKPQVNGKTPNSKDKGKENQTPKKNEPVKIKTEPKTPKTPNNAVQAKTPNDKSKTPSDKSKTPKTPKRTLKGGIVVEDLKIGTGPEASRGKMCGFYYEGRLKENNKKFDSCQSGDPFKFRLGSGEVIKGWDVGLEGMKVGGKRRIVVPAKMGYGDKGAGPAIPPNATLVFEVECKNVK